MKQNPKNIKLIIFSAVVLIVLLLVCSVFQLVSIKNKREIIAEQQAEIMKLKSALDYYQNQNSDNSDDKDSDINIEVGN